jgi:hypothetical protein
MPHSLDKPATTWTLSPWYFSSSMLISLMICAALAVRYSGLPGAPAFYAVTRILTQLKTISMGCSGSPIFMVCYLVALGIRNANRRDKPSLLVLACQMQILQHELPCNQATPKPLRIEDPIEAQGRTTRAVPSLRT